MACDTMSLEWSGVEWSGVLIINGITHSLLYINKGR